jgi:hypothetical protein
MAIITVGFSSPIEKKIGAESIKFYLGTDYSHVYVKFKSESLNRTMIYHAAHGMVHFIEEANFLKTNKVIKEYTLEISDELLIKLKQRCIDLAGIEYGFDELPKIVINDICINLNIKYKVVDSKGYICSELVADILEETLEVKFNKPKNLITPKDIDTYLEKHG